jgi:HSP20 family protein
MATTLAKREGFELPETVRRFFAGDWESPSLRVEEFEDGDTHVVRVEAPGIDPEKDVEVSMTEGVLHLQVERREQSEHTDKSTYRSEFRYGSFSRDIVLPPGSLESEVRAEYRDGVLEVRMPLAAERTSTIKVPVSRS